MRCPYCNSASRVDKKGESGDFLRREQSCNSCGKKFVTYEKADLKNLAVVKRDGRREPYSRNKITSSIIKACIKCDVSPQVISRISEMVEKRLFLKKRAEIKSSYIGELVMSALKGVNKVAYVRFASAYKDFYDINKYQEAGKSVV